MPRHDGTETLEERLRFARQRALAAKCMIDGGQRQIDEIDREIAQLRDKRNFLSNQLEAAPDTLVDAEREAEKLDRLIKQRDYAYPGQRDTGAGLRHKKDRAERLRERLASLRSEIESLNLTDEQVAAIIAEARGERVDAD